MAERTIARRVGTKGDETIDGYAEIGATFADVIDTRSSSNYSLQQFFDHYLNYMKNGQFIYEGDSQPNNPHNVIWIDTSTTNQANLNTTSE